MVSREAIVFPLKAEVWRSVLILS